MTYVKDWSARVKVKSEEIGNLSDIIKGNFVQSNNLFQQITRDLLQLNITFHGQSAQYTTIKQMEFSLLQLTQHIDDLFDADRYAMSGKLLVKLIILRKVTLTLPEDYEVGANFDNICLYYDLVEVAIVAEIHLKRFILNVPLNMPIAHLRCSKWSLCLSVYRLIDLLNIQLISSILVYNTINRLTYC
jgi:hypothetical protein